MSALSHNPLFEESEEAACEAVETPCKRKVGVGVDSLSRSAKPASSGSAPVAVKEASATQPLTPRAPCPFSKCIPDGALVVLKDFAGRRTLARADLNEQQAESAFALDARVLVGCPYGSTFTWKEGTWRRTQRTRALERDFADPATEEECQIDNRDITDSNSAQKLSATEIEAIRLRNLRRAIFLKALRCHTSADQLLRHIAANSETFERRTAFAKQKYILRKAKKHIRQFTVLEATLREICEYYYCCNPTKIIGLRHDYLSAILNFADLRPGQKVLILDHALGLPTAGVLMRLADSGKVYRLLESGFVGDRALREMNGSQALMRRLVDVNIEHRKVETRETGGSQMYQVLEAKLSGCSAKSDSSQAATAPSCEGPSVPESLDGCDETLSQREKSLASRDRTLREAAQAAVETLEKKGSGLSSVISVISPFRVRRSKEDEGLSTEELTRRLLYKTLVIGFQFLRPGGRMVVYSQAFEFLAQTHAAMCASPDFLNVQFEELLLREMQVAPGRTHPVMDSKIAIPSGFLLSATKVSR